jgi:hypothetical protein
MNIRLGQFGGVIPFFGMAVGVTVAFSSDHSVSYDLYGRACVLQGGIGEPKTELMVG